MHTTVAVIGGGYGGVAVAKALDAVTDVTLIEPKDSFVHNVAALRAIVDPQWVDQVFFPYDRLLSRGEVVHERAVNVDANSVTLGSGRQVTADYIVLATGSGYPFPAKIGENDHMTAKARLRSTHEALAESKQVMLVGAGPVGLELAGEIKAAWPEKEVTIVGRDDDIVPGDYPERFRDELHRQLAALEIKLVLGDALADDPGVAPGNVEPFTVGLESGARVAADIWFACYGVTPVSDYLAEDLSAARQPNGQITVNDDLRLPGQSTVFAIGDLTAIPEPKQAAAAEEHAGVVVANITALLSGDELIAYEPGPAGIVLPLGPTGGASYAPGWESYLDDESAAHIRSESAGDELDLLGADVLNAAITAQFKGEDLMTTGYAETFGGTGR